MLSLWLAALAFASPVEIGGARIELAFEKFPRAASDEEVRAFVARSAEPVAAYYGRFPVKKLRVEVVPNKRGGLFGREFHGNRVVFYLGRNAHPKESGILTHEMFHLGFPDLANEHAWIEEGLATYLAHLSMARLGQTPEKEFWQDLRSGFEDAQPHDGDGGLVDADDYRRIYWGGALFWLEIDLEIREHSRGQKSLDTVTRAILESGGTNAHRWSLRRLERAVDRTAGFEVFGKWYAYLGKKPGRVDLVALWKKLGVDGEGALQRNLPPLAKP